MISRLTLGTPGLTGSKNAVEMQLLCKVLLPSVICSMGLTDDSNCVVPEQFNKTVKKLYETYVHLDLGRSNLGGTLHMHE